MSATTGSVSNQARKSTEASPSALRPLVVRPLVVSPLVVIPLVVRPLVVSPLVVRPLLVSSASGVGPAGGGAEQAARLAAVAASAANHVRSLRLCAIDLSLARPRVRHEVLGRPGAETSVDRRGLSRCTMIRGGSPGATAPNPGTMIEGQEPGRSGALWEWCFNDPPRESPQAHPDGVARGGSRHERKGER